MHHDIHISPVSLLLVYRMFLLQILLCTCCFVDLTFHVLFLSVLKKKIQKSIKKLKNLQKVLLLVLCISHVSLA